MEYILINLFGGGVADWQDISQTKYYWDEIFSNLKDRMELENIDINDLYEQIMLMARDELYNEMAEYAGKANTREEIAIAKILENIDVEEDFDIFANCLDSHINFIGTEEQAKIIQEVFREKIDELDDKIGFTYINFD